MKFPKNNLSTSQVQWTCDVNNLVRTVISNFNYRDNLARERRRRFFLRLWLVTAAILAAGGGVVYAVLFSGWFDVDTIDVKGLKSIDKNQARSVIDLAFRKNILATLKIRINNNILLFNPEKARSELLASFPEIRNVTVAKNFPHTLVISVTERTVAGTWCSVDKCRYFDEEGVLWGEAIKTSGSLLLAVYDLRPDVVMEKVGADLIGQIRKITAGLERLGLKMIKMEIPADSMDDLHVRIAGNYVIIFNSGGDINRQINILRIFLDEHKDESGFRPQYIDLRIEGRVYYKK